MGTFVLASASSGYGQTASNQDNTALFRQTWDAVAGQENSSGTIDESILQGVDDQTTAAIIDPDQEALQTNRQPAQRSNVRAAAVEMGTVPVVEEDPFAPVGIQVGSLRLTSFFKQSVGFTTNKQSGALGDGGAFSFSEVNFQLRSQWQRHELAINANGSYEDYFDRYIEPSPKVDIDGSLRLDLINGFAATIGSNYSFETEAASSPSLTSTAINEPGVHKYGAFTQLQRSGHRIDLTLRGSIDRSVYEVAKLSGGGTFSQADRDLTTYSLKARVGYQTRLAYNPFIQAVYSKRVHDLNVDRNGERRDSVSYELRGGVVVDLSEKISGEVSAGYVVQDFVEPGLAALAGFVVDANLNWSPQRDTNIALIMGSSLGGSTTAGDSGAITYNGALAISRRIRDDLEINGRVGLAYTNYEGLNRIDTTYTAELGFEHWLNRTLSITGETRYLKLDSSIMANSYDATVFMLGVKVQR